jgi:hypothetical protein
LAAEWKALRRGWYVGSETFLAKLEEHLKRAVQGRKRESHSGPAKAAHDEAGAELLLEAGLRAIGLSEAALARLSKGAAPKVVLAWWLRQRTAVPLRWVSERLAMGHYTRVTQAVSRMNRRPGRRLQVLQRKLERLPTGE